ncbi:MAG: hypothetical protein GEV11_25145 [Streptosporangiales bacterium]|nr:hypothetical protein [Streptosporangiales bacterium]
MEAMVTTRYRPSYTRIGREREAVGERQALHAVLRARGLSVSDAQRRVIEETTDLDLLLEWVTRAVTVESTDELLNGD